jgi:hypothetical protein
MFDVLIDIFMEFGAAVFRLLPKPFQRNVAPDSILGQAIGLVLAVLLLVTVAAVIYKLQ